MSKALFLLLTLAHGMIHFIGYSKAFNHSSSIYLTKTISKPWGILWLSSIAKEKKTVKAEYKEKIAELEAKNTDMKKKIEEYKLDGKDKWSTFKTDFDREMDELGKSINDVIADKN